MIHTRLWLSAAIIALVIVVSFVLSVPHTRRDPPRAPSLSATASSSPIVTLRDSYRKGVHTITGSIEAPNACTTVTALATLASGGSSPEHIQVALSMPKDIGVCLALPTRITFSTTLAAPADLPLTVTVNGAQATTTTS